MADLIVKLTDETRTLDDIDLSTVGPWIHAVVTGEFTEIKLHGQNNGVLTRHQVRDIREITIRL